MLRKNLAFDAQTKRHKDENGFLHVSSSHITKEQVAPYYGFEIPNHEQLKLEPKKIYYGYRSAEELQKAVSTFNGLPLMLHHHVVSADDTKKDYRVGSVGTSAIWNAPYIDNALTITDQVGIDAVESGQCREISVAYLYDPDFTSGQFEGITYDFIMRNIRGNHVALVEEGRAGRDVVVSDAQINLNLVDKGNLIMTLKSFFDKVLAKDSNPDIEKKEVDLAQEIIDLHKKDPATGEIKDVQVDEDKCAKIKEIIGNLTKDADPETVKSLTDALSDLNAKVDAIEEEAKDEDITEKDVEVKDVEEKKEAEDEDETEKDVEVKNVEVKDVDAEDEDETEKVDVSVTEKDVDEEKSALDKAMQACGLDSDDENVKKAFVEGMNFKDKKELANDSKRVMANDHALIEKRIRKDIEARYKAVDAVSEAVGKVDPMAFDSAQSIYVHALTEMGIPKGSYASSSAKDMFNIILKTRQAQIAQDHAPKVSKYTGAFAGLNTIK